MCLLLLALHTLALAGMPRRKNGSETAGGQALLGWQRHGEGASGAECGQPLLAALAGHSGGLSARPTQRRPQV